MRTPQHRQLRGGPPPFPGYHLLPTWIRCRLTRRFFERFRAGVAGLSTALAAECPTEATEDLAAEALLGSTDGQCLFESLVMALA